MNILGIKLIIHGDGKLLGTSLAKPAAKTTPADAEEVVDLILADAIVETRQGLAVVDVMLTDTTFESSATETSGNR